MEQNNSRLRFAAFRRVSTEQQERTGESLRTQKIDIEASVEQLKGKIVVWYGGQEHAMPGYEKSEIDRLLADAQKKVKLFNAVIVTNADRWSRDNEKSRQGLDIFKEQEIRFFIGTFEHDLVNPDHRLILGLSAEIGQFFASNQKLKSIKSRINRAKRGIPTGGKIPFGRIFDKKTGQWSIDKEKQALIKTVAKRYLAGEKLSDLAEEFGMNHSNLHKILTLRCGDLWSLEFNSDDLKIHEEVKMQIPLLLPDDIIKAIRKKAEANKTYQHGQSKNSYLLSRMIFCKHCGYTMFGQTNSNRRSYYRHAHSKRKRDCKQTKTWVNANELEDIVMRYLFECFGNPQAVQKAIEKATPNLEKVKEYQKRIEDIEDLQNKIKTSREKILRFISSERITESDAAKQLDELKQKEIKLQTERQQLYENMESNPTPDKIKAMSKKVSAQFNKYSLQLRIGVARWVAANRPYNEMTSDEKKALVQMVFSGKMPDGRRMGVYIEWNEKDWKFNIHGHLIDEESLIPLSDAKRKAYFNEDGGYSIWKHRELLTKSALYLRDISLPVCHFRPDNLPPAA